MADQNSERERHRHESIHEFETKEKDSSLIDRDATGKSDNTFGMSQHGRVNDEIRKGFPGFDTLRCEIATDEAEQNLLQMIQEELINGTNDDVISKSEFEQLETRYSGPSSSTSSFVEQVGSLSKIDDLRKKHPRIMVIPHPEMTDFLSKSVNIWADQTGGLPRPPIDTVLRRQLAFLGSEYSDKDSFDKAGKRFIKSRIYSGIISMKDRDIEDIQVSVTLFGRRKDNKSEIKNLQRDTNFEPESDTDLTDWYENNFLPFLGYKIEQKEETEHSFPMASGSNRRYNEYLSIIDVDFDLNKESSVEDVIPTIRRICIETIGSFLQRLTSLHGLILPEFTPEEFGIPDRGTIPRWYRGGNIVRHVEAEGIDCDTNKTNFEYTYRFASMYQYALESVQ